MRSKSLSLSKSQKRSGKSAFDASTKDELINVAQKVFANAGFKEATIRDICKQARANVCLISYYFGGKDSLYRAVFEKVAIERLDKMKEFMKALPSIKTAEEYKMRFALAIQAVYAEVYSKPDFYKLCQREIHDGFPRAGDVVKGYFTATRDMFIEFIEFGQKRKFLKKNLDSHLAFMTIMNLITAFVGQQLADPDYFFKKGFSEEEISAQVVKTVTSIYFEGVLA